MNKLYAFVAAAGLMGSASLALAQEKTEEPAPIPALGCEFKSFNACSPDGSCKSGADVPGIVIPLKVTLDFENNVLSAVDETGSPRTDKFDSVAGLRRST